MFLYTNIAPLKCFCKKTKTKKPHQINWLTVLKVLYNVNFVYQNIVKKKKCVVIQKWKQGVALKSANPSFIVETVGYTWK